MLAVVFETIIAFVLPARVSKFTTAKTAISPVIARVDDEPADRNVSLVAAKRITGRPLRALGTSCGSKGKPRDCIKLFPFPDRSFHWFTPFASVVTPVSALIQRAVD